MRVLPRHRFVAATVLLFVILVLVAGCAGTTTPTQPASTQAPATQSSATAESPTAQPPTTIQAGAGSSESGDPYFPAAGNGGYDVQSYEISLDIDPASGHIVGEDIVTATALQDLAAFYLDFVGLDVSEILVGGKAAHYERDGQELKVTCPEPLAAGSQFSVKVSYSGTPKPRYSENYSMGWRKVGDTIYTLDEPRGASSWFAVNDTPADKATYTFRLTVPQPYSAVANGVLVSTERQGTDQTFVWKMDKPMASYLAAVNVGNFVTEDSTSAGGVAIRNYFAPGVAATAHTAFARMGEIVDYFSSVFGPYPFSACGAVAVDADIDVAMENQTLLLFGRNKLSPNTGLLAHELAHQWVGDSVTIKHWDDIWLNEGFATYASWLWFEHDDGPWGLEAEVQRAQQILSDQSEPAPGDPGAKHMFGDGVYWRGALTLHALRLTVGDDSFLRTLRTWAQRYEYGNVETADFIALAKEEAPQVPPAALDALFDAWLNQPELPALPPAAG